MSEKKIKFTGDASDLLSEFEKIKRRGKEISASMFDDAQKYSKVLKEQYAYMQERIKQSERGNIVNKKGAIFDLENAHQQRLKSAGTQLDRNELEKEYREKLANIKKEFNEEKIMIDVLKDILKTLQEEAKLNYEQDEKQDAAFAAAGFGGGGSGGGGGLGLGNANDSDDNINNFNSENFKDKVADAIKEANEESNEKENKKSSLFQALTLDRLMQSFNQIASQVVHAKSSEDIVKPSLEMFGAGIGGGAGLLFGQSAGGALIGKSIATHFGDAYNRHISEQQNFLGASNRLGALTSMGGGSGSAFGLSQGDYLSLQEQILRSSGQTGELDKRANLTLGLNKGYGVDQSTLLQSYSTDLYTKMSSAANLSQIVGELEKRGIITKENRLPLTEFIKSQTALISQYSKNIDTVNQKNISNTLLSFDSLGGSFSVNDPRSLSTIQGIGNKLSNPSNDYEKAFNFGIARQTLGENASFLDMLKLQEQGFGHDKGFDFFKNTVDAVKNRGGSKDLQALSLKARFGDSLNFNQIESLLSSDLTKERTSQGNLKDIFNNIVSQGQGRVTDVEKQTAEITDAFVKGATDGIAKVGELFIDKLEDILKKEVKTKVKEAFNNLFGNDPNPKQRKR